MRRLALVLLVAVAVLAAGGCAKKLGDVPGLRELGRISGLTPTDEEVVAAVLQDVQRGMESQKIFKVLSHVSQNYQDEEGRDYAAVEAGLRSIFKKYREIKITRATPRIAIDGDRARAVETFGAVAEPQNRVTEPPVNIQGQTTVELVRIDGQWLIVKWGKIM
ncbi:MAG: hypothetical protein GWP08_08805 [Nitrospiraceae bacterium]|nr:hypothetical protein [Nitrospiraceae bacterium]